MWLWGPATRYIYVCGFRPELALLCPCIYTNQWGLTGQPDYCIRSKYEGLNSISENTILKCGVPRSLTKTPCDKVAGWGTNHVGSGPCRDHGGKLQTVDQHHQDIKAREVIKTLGLPLEVNPAQALLNLVHEAAGNVEWYRIKVSELGDKITVPDRIKTEEVKAVLRAYNEERDRLAKYAKLCVEIGIADRLVRIEEKQAETMTAIVRGLIRRLDLGPSRELEAFGIVREELLRLSSARVIDMPPSENRSIRSETTKLRKRDAAMTAKENR